VAVAVVHWDEVETFRSAKGEMDGTWQRLGDAAGSQSVGVNRVRIAPGKLPTPPHSHGASEELYFVLEGWGLAWQDGQVHEVRPLDCVIHRADAMEHTFIAGSDGLELLVFGTRHSTEIGWLPRSRAIRIGWPWAEGRDDDPWDIEAAGPPLEVGDPAPRPANIRNVDELELQTHRYQSFVYFTPDETTKLAGLGWEKLPAGHRGSAPHCHSAEEEVFVILGGTALLELWSPQGEVTETTELRAGHIVVREPGSRVSHSFRAGADGVEMLVYGTRDPNDVAWFPRSQKIHWRGLGVIGRIETLEYMDGEPSDDD
jgi:uncharacterized cupin superfamily protein